MHLRPRHRSLPGLVMFEILKSTTRGGGLETLNNTAGPRNRRWRHWARTTLKSQIFISDRNNFEFLISINMREAQNTGNSNESNDKNNRNWLHHNDCFIFIELSKNQFWQIFTFFQSNLNLTKANLCKRLGILTQINWTNWLWDRSLDNDRLSQNELLSLQKIHDNWIVQLRQPINYV